MPLFPCTVILVRPSRITMTWSAVSPSSMSRAPAANVRSSARLLNSSCCAGLSAAQKLGAAATGGGGCEARPDPLSGRGLAGGAPWERGPGAAPPRNSTAPPPVIVVELEMTEYRFADPRLFRLFHGASPKIHFKPEVTAHRQRQGRPWSIPVRRSAVRAACVLRRTTRRPGRWQQPVHSVPLGTASDGRSRPVSHTNQDPLWTV